MKTAIREILIRLYRKFPFQIQKVIRKGYALYSEFKFFYHKHRGLFNTKQTIINMLKEQNSEIPDKHIEYILSYSKRSFFRDIQGLIHTLSFNSDDTCKQIMIYELMHPELYAKHKKILDELLMELYLQKNCTDVFIFLSLTYKFYLQKKIESVLKPSGDDALSPFVYAMQ